MRKSRNYHFAPFLFASLFLLAACGQSPPDEKGVANANVAAKREPVAVLSGAKAMTRLLDLKGNREMFVALKDTKGSYWALSAGDIESVGINSSELPANTFSVRVKNGSNVAIGGGDGDARVVGLEMMIEACCSSGGGYFLRNKDDKLLGTAKVTGSSGKAKPDTKIDVSELVLVRRVLNRIISNDDLTVEQ